MMINNDYDSMNVPWGLPAHVKAPVVEEEVVTVKVVEEEDTTDDVVVVVGLTVVEK